MNKPPAKNMVLIYAALAAVTFAAFEPVRHNEFIKFDDDRYITGNQHVQSGLNRSSVLWAFGFTKIVYWMPLAWLSHILDCQLFGLKSGMHHLTSLLIHIANTLLLFAVFKRMTGRLWPSAFVTALFALHPLNVDSVAWISERKNILSTFFWMLTMLAYVCYTEKPSVSRYLLIITAFVFGLLSKPMLVTLPCVLLLLDYWPLKRITPELKNIKKPVLEKLPLFALTAVSTYLSSISFKDPDTTQVVSMKLRTANALVSYIKYILKLIWPTDLALLYPYPASVPALQVVGSVLLLVCVSAIVILLIRKKPYLLTGWLWYTGTLVPVLGLVQIGLWPAMADRWMYVPAVGIFIMLAWGADELTGKLPLRKPLLITAGCIIIAAMLICTRTQVMLWRNSVALFNHTLAITQNNPIISNNLGVALAQQGRYDQAVENYRKAIRDYPDYAEAYYNLGIALQKQGQNDEAISSYRQALKLNPDYAKAYLDLGVTLLAGGRSDEAVFCFNKTIRLKPDSVEAYNNLGQLFLSQGKLDEAIGYFRRALQIEPDYILSLCGLAKILATHPDPKIRDLSHAISMAERAAELTKYQDVMVLERLAAVYASAKQFEQAAETSGKALVLAVAAGDNRLAVYLRKQLENYKKQSGQQ
jgi:Flp pilus assembly protein TadD